MSEPLPPVSVSFPAKPSRVSLAVPPTIELSLALPVILIAFVRAEALAYLILESSVKGDLVKLSITKTSPEGVVYVPLDKVPSILSDDKVAAPIKLILPVPTVRITLPLIFSEVYLAPKIESVEVVLNPVIKSLPSPEL